MGLVGRVGEVCCGLVSTPLVGYSIYDDHEEGCCFQCCYLVPDGDIGGRAGGGGAQNGGGDLQPDRAEPVPSGDNGSGKPSPECCAKLKEQVPCLCGYISNPVTRPYINSPNAKNIAEICGVEIPKC
ncbi:hypothetical protein DH2020_037498 [Rehmannia glutinosa]|uniref:Bifunctional inhibitor/plant lipid transfer protein/seed storage helical domain-containing protein n=1 Tax=Rehmannia glutinosa TaxID=99300 RepID=A0ABR0V231_REHGL